MILKLDCFDRESFYTLGPAYIRHFAGISAVRDPRSFYTLAPAVKLLRREDRGVDFTFLNSAKFHSCYRRVTLSLNLTAPADDDQKFQDHSHRDNC